jgi:hypothetical protein
MLHIRVVLPQIFGRASFREVGVRVPVGSRIFTSPGRPDRLWGPPNLLYNGYWGLFPMIKRPGREADHSPSTSAEVKKMWIYTSIPPYAFISTGTTLPYLVSLDFLGASCQMMEYSLKHSHDIPLKIVLSPPRTSVLLFDATWRWRADKYTKIIWREPLRILHWLTIYLWVGRAIDQAVSRRLPTAAARVRSLGQVMWDLGWTKGH